MGRYEASSDISVLVGKTLFSVVKNTEHDDYIMFETNDGESYKMYHSQDCCENVVIEEIHGDLEDLVGHPILVAEERSNNNHEEQNARGEDGYGTWTFYELRTIKGSVTIRWYGSSNGYYSEGVDFTKVHP